ncbi:MAG: hypothetical protein ACRDLA_17265, partial [Thermoleophilaceae bacterium]
VLDRVVERADEVSDDMTACVVRAVAGSESVAPRVEELELEPDELGSATPGRFLVACGLAAEAIAPVLAEANRTAASGGAVLLRVTIDAAGTSASVTRPTPEALATT